MKFNDILDAHRRSQKLGEIEGAADLRSRARYMLEKERIKQEIGDLNQIRATLGLSQRRLCQLLLVDPSAWTRWNKKDAPPHIYQALRWLINLKKINPEAAGPRDLESKIDMVQARAQEKIRDLEQNVAMLEKAMTFSPAAPSSISDGIFEKALVEQEMRFQEQIRMLESKLQLLVQVKTKVRSQKKRKTKQAVKKAGKQVLKKFAKLPVKKAFKKKPTAKKSMRRLRNKNRIGLQYIKTRKR